MIVFILLGRAGIFNFMGGSSDIINGLVAAAAFPIVLVLALCTIVLIINIVAFIPLTIHKIKAVYNYTYLPLTADEIKYALERFNRIFGSSAKYSILCNTADKGIVTPDTVELRLKDLHIGPPGTQPQRCTGIGLRNILNIVGFQQFNIVAIIVF